MAILAPHKSRPEEVAAPRKTGSFDLASAYNLALAQPRFREYRYEEDSEAGKYPGPKGEIWNLGDSKAFREEALAKTVSPAMQRAYWEVRLDREPGGHLIAERPHGGGAGGEGHH